MLRDQLAAAAEGLPVTSPPVLVDLPRIRERRGVLFLAVRTNNRPAIATTIERLIDFLDAQEVDPDLEPNGDELDASYPEGGCKHFPSLHEDDEDGHDREHDPAELGIADADALSLFYGGNGEPTFVTGPDGTGCVFLRPTEAARQAI